LKFGEQDVLNLAIEQPPFRLIIDDSAARNEARGLGFGDLLLYTSDILKLAGEKGWLDYNDAMKELKEKGEILPES
jgi:predicted nucleic acid-binding protein